MKISKHTFNFKIPSSEFNLWLKENFNLEEKDPLEGLGQDEIESGWAWDMACLDYRDKGISFSLSGESEGEAELVPSCYSLEKITFHIMKNKDYDTYQGVLPLSLSLSDKVETIKEKLGSANKVFQQENEFGDTLIKALEYLKDNVVYKIYFSKNGLLHTIVVEMSE